MKISRSVGFSDNSLNLCSTSDGTKLQINLNIGLQLAPISSVSSPFVMTNFSKYCFSRF